MPPFRMITGVVHDFFRLKLAVEHKTTATALNQILGSQYKLFRFFQMVRKYIYKDRYIGK